MRYLLLLVAILLLIPAISAQDVSPTPAYTFQNADGNRYLADAQGTFPDVLSIDVDLTATPLWIVGGLVDEIPAWTVALEGGAVIVTQPVPNIDDVSGLSLEIGQIAPSAPITALYDGVKMPQLLTAGEDIASLSTPVVVDAADMTLVYGANNGDLVLWREDVELDRIALGIQADGLPVISDDGLIAVYTNGTDQRYVHGIMGDDIEGAGLAVIDPSNNTLTVTANIDLPDNDVFEGISPFWADIDSDGAQDIVTTVSNGSLGAGIRAYTVSGNILAESRFIGQGFRWRHQLAAAPFGINGEYQIVDIRTPHIGGMVEFFDYDNGALVVNNAQLGYTSHIIGSRNLDMGLAGDFNGNGKPELVVTDQIRQNVAGVENTLEGVTEVWRLPLDGTLTTNFAAVTLLDGTLALAAGTDRGMLRVWLPQ